MTRGTTLETLADLAEDQWGLFTRQQAAAAGLANPGRPLEVPLLGRADWWALWYRALGFENVPQLRRMGANLSAEYLDVTQALAGDGIAIGSPILFRNEIDSGRLVPAHDRVASDGRSFWFTFPTVRQHSRKIVSFREWLCEEASRACDGAADFIRGAS